MKYRAISTCLRATPYQLPDRFQLESRLNVVLDREARIQARLHQCLENLRRSGLFSVVDPYQKSKEIFESNAIEGLGPDLRQTHSILSQSRGTVEEALAELSIASDPDFIAVVGLHGAKLLAKQMQKTNPDHGSWTETDLRSLHSLICQGEDHAGRYKRYHVRIGGMDAHEPVLPVDVPDAMHQLVTWLNEDFGPTSPSVRAASAHAWLTHIHPFEDGNGRLARILANSILQGSGMPPAIVKSSSQRGAYLDALRHSDDGGDIFPLADLFISTSQRYVRELSKPAALEKIILRELSGRSDAPYERWSRTFREFQIVLVLELQKQRLSVKNHGFLDAESFNFIQDLNARGNSWLLSVLDEEGRELLLWFGYPTSDIRGQYRKEKPNPAIYFSVRNHERFGFHPFRAVRSELSGLSQLAVYPGPPERVFAVVDGRVRFGGVSDSAAEIANTIGQAFRAGRIPLEMVGAG